MGHKGSGPSSRESDVQPWFSELQSQNDERVVQAIEALADRGEPDAVGPIMAVLERAMDDYESRALAAAAVQALGRLGATEAEPLLIRSLGTGLYFLQAEAARALGRVDASDEALDEVGQVLDEEAPAEVKRAAIRGLGDTGRPRAVAHLADVLEREEDHSLKDEAVRALGRAAREEAADPLMRFFQSEAGTHLRRQIVEALARIASASSVDFLLAQLGDPDAAIRSGAAEALGETLSRRAVGPLQQALADDEEVVRRAAARGLGLIEFLPRPEDRWPVVE